MRNLQIKMFLRSVLSCIYFASKVYNTVHLGSVLILMYHRVIDNKQFKHDLIQPGMYVRKETFKNHISFLVKNYEIISFDDLILHMNRKSLNNNKQYCIITFDDGWKDNYLHAYPILKAYNVPATIFIVPSFIEKEKCFWARRFERLTHYLLTSGKKMKCQEFNSVVNKLHLETKTIESLASLFANKITERSIFIKRINIAIEQLKMYNESIIEKLLADLERAIGHSENKTNEFLEWDDIHEMSENRISFASHSMTHKILTSCTLDKLKVEIEKSHLFLNGKGINYVPVFSYPNGDFNNLVIDLVKQTGYSAATTTRPGVNKLENINRYLLKRISIHENVTGNVQMFAFHLGFLGKNNFKK